MNYSNPEDFVRVWQNANSVADVVKAFPGRTPGACSNRARYFRRIGIPLKRMIAGKPFGVGSINVYALKIVCEEMRPK